MKYFVLWRGEHLIGREAGKVANFLDWRAYGPYLVRELDEPLGGETRPLSEAHRKAGLPGNWGSG